MNVVVFHTDSEFKVVFPFEKRHLANVTLRRMLRQKRITSFSKITRFEYVHAIKKENQDQAEDNRRWLANNATLDDICKASKLKN